MSNSIPQDPKDPRKPLEISPSASDDFEAGKNSSVASSPVKPVIHDRGNATGVASPKKNK